VDRSIEELAPANSAGAGEIARAKVNLALHVLGRRGDGWHDLDSLVTFTGAADRLCAEPGLDMPELDLPFQAFPDINMYFGGVSVATFGRDTGFEVAADPRREGGILLPGA
jgi:hypothetical protein